MRKEKLLSGNTVNEKQIVNDIEDDDDDTSSNCITRCGCSIINVLSHKSFALLIPYYTILEIASYTKFSFMAAYGAAYLSGCHTIKENNNCHNDYKYDEYNIYYNFAVSIAGLLSFLFAGFIGALSDSFGRKLFLYIQLIITAMPYIIMLFYNNLYVYLAIFAVIGINGGTYPTTPISASMVADCLPENKRIIGYGWFYILSGIGLGIGAIIGFMTAYLVNDHFNFYVIVILFIISLLYLILFVPETLKKEDRKPFNSALLRNPLKALDKMRTNKVILWIGILYLFINLPDVGIAGIIIPVFSDVYNSDTESKSNTIALLYLGGLALGLLFGPIVVLPAFKIFFNDYIILLITILILAFSLLFFSLVLIIKQMFMIPIVGFIFGHSYLCLPAANSILSKYTSKYELGVAFGVVNAMSGITNVIAPFGFAMGYHYLREIHLGFIIFIIALLLVVIAFIAALFPLKNAINNIQQQNTSITSIDGAIAD